MAQVFGSLPLPPQRERPLWSAFGGHVGSEPAEGTVASQINLKFKKFKKAPASQFSNLWSTRSQETAEADHRAPPPWASSLHPQSLPGAGHRCNTLSPSRGCAWRTRGHAKRKRHPMRLQDRSWGCGSPETDHRETQETGRVCSTKGMPGTATHAGPH